MGQVCGKSQQVNTIINVELHYDPEDQVIKSEYVSEFQHKAGKPNIYSLKRSQPMITYPSMLKAEQQQNLKLLMKQELYKEFEHNLYNEQKTLKESLQIILNVYLYCKFKREDIKVCFDSLNTNIDYKSNLELIGIYRESQLNYHKNGTCFLCSLENKECYSLKCQHIFCKDCWNLMIEIQLSNYIPIVKCLQNLCQERLPHQFLELNQYYQEILIKRMLENDKNYTWCPGFNCQNIYKVERISYKWKCECGVNFCSNCKTESHYPITCQIFNEITKFKEPLQSWVNLDISQCPNCKIYIQKNEGCLQVKCVCSCNFCSQCQQPWKEAHQQDFYKCPFADYNKNPSQQFIQMNLQESQITKSISHLEYYTKKLNQQQNFYYENQTHLFQISLGNLIKFMKFEKIVVYFKYYIDEKYSENELDHYCEQYSLEIKNYYKILQNQLSDFLSHDLKIENTQNLDFNQFQNLVYQMDQNLRIQKKSLKKQIIEIQLQKQQNFN